MAAAAATLSESIPAYIGIRVRTAAPSDQCFDSPAPSVPSSTATLAPGAMLAANSSSSTSSDDKLSATVRKPAAASISGAVRQSSSRAHGKENTAPMLTLIDRR
jgi:hypothetical protein